MVLRLMLEPEAIGWVEAALLEDGDEAGIDVYAAAVAMSE